MSDYAANINKVLELATDLHEGQVRKYSGEPYILHPVDVLDLYKKIEESSGKGLSFINRSICLLHDTIEDCEISGEDLTKNLINIGINPEYAMNISDGVLYLTNVYTKDKYQNLNKEERSILEAYRLQKISSSLKTIKVCDMICNLRELRTQDKGYFRKYFAEKKRCFQVMNIHGPAKVLFESNCNIWEIEDGISF